MDIMDSSDTPEGGMNQQTTSATTSPPVGKQRELPLSVDEDNQRQPLPNQHHSSSSSSSSSRLFTNDDREVNAYPTSQDDVMMSTTDHTSSSLSNRLSGGLSTLKEKMKEGVDSMENKLEQGKEAVEKEWNKHQSSASSSYTASSKSTTYDDTNGSNTTGSAEMNSGNMTGAPSRDKESLVHPLASNMRDPHLHPGAVSLPTHANEHSSVSPVNTHYVSDARARGLEAAKNLEPKDESAHAAGSGSITDTIHSLGDKVDQGINTLREKVNSWGSTQGATSTQSTQGSPSSSHVAKNDGVARVETHTENSVEPKPAPYSLIDKTNTANIDVINRRQNQNSTRTD